MNKYWVVTERNPKGKQSGNSHLAFYKVSLVYVHLNKLGEEDTFPVRKTDVMGLQIPEAK